MIQFKRFFKYRALPYFQIFLINRARVKLPIIAITTGAALIGSPWLPFIISLLARTSAKVTWLDQSQAIIATLVGLCLIVWGVYLANKHMVRIEQNATEKTKAIIKQYSINSSEKNEISKNPKRISYVVLDQRKKDFESEIEWIKRSLLKQKGVIKDVNYILERWDEPTLHYEGIAHIPFVFLLGYQLSDKRDIIFSEWNENTRKWVSLPQSVDEYPPLLLHKSLEVDANQASDISICVSLTEEIYPEQLKGLKVYGKPMYHLKLRKCMRHAIVCKEQLADYTAEFRSLLDDIKSEHREVKTIHIFISAQTSLVHSFGGTLTRNDPEVRIYNFNRERTIKYPWGLKIQETSDSENINMQIFTQSEEEHIQTEKK
ncbi:SAVED domain-containing protein [Halobacillus trueperi]|uniref:SAVED domain-containing protein n=1 Tax=Halobacillus trueperi TaxID=156205 RepID=UPI00142E2DF0|nr:SAVED domain-containing protein [Halobacillus trueperi]